MDIRRAGCWYTLSTARDGSSACATDDVVHSPHVFQQGQCRARECEGTCRAVACASLLHCLSTISCVGLCLSTSTVYGHVRYSEHENGNETENESIVYSYTRIANEHKMYELTEDIVEVSYPPVNPPHLLTSPSSHPEHEHSTSRTQLPTGHVVLSSPLRPDPTAHPLPALSIPLIGYIKKHNLPISFLTPAEPHAPSRKPSIIHHHRLSSTRHTQPRTTR